VLRAWPGPRIAFEAKTKLGQLLDWVEAGEEVIITATARSSPGWCRQTRRSIESSLVVLPPASRSHMPCSSPCGTAGSMKSIAVPRSRSWRCCPSPIDDDTSLHAWSATLHLAERFSLTI
jgi:hypothetical protein